MDWRCTERASAHRSEMPWRRLRQCPPPRVIATAREFLYIPPLAKMIGGFFLQLQLSADVEPENEGHGGKARPVDGTPRQMWTKVAANGRRARRGSRAEPLCPGSRH